MSKVIFALTIILSVLSNLSECQGSAYYPDWTNCNSESEVQFIDFYMDHQPSHKHSVNTISFCAGEGKQLAIGDINVRITDKDTKELMSESYPSLEHIRFTNGMFDRCLQAGILEFIEANDYTLTLTINSTGSNSTQIACLQATWTIEANQDSLMKRLLD